MSMVFCRGCGKEIHESAVSCPHCGAPQKKTAANGVVSSKEVKSQTLAAVLAAFVGGLGVHRFYLRKIVSGVFYLIFSWTGIPLLISAIETYLIAFMSPKDWAKKYNESELSAPVPGIVKFLLLLPALILLIAFFFGIGRGIVVPAVTDYRAKGKVFDGVLSLSACKTAIAESYATGQIPKGNVYEFCASESNGIKGYGLATGSKAAEVTAFFDGGALEGKEISAFADVTSDGSVQWECWSSTIPTRLLPKNCSYNPSRKLNTARYQSYSDYVAQKTANTSARNAAQSEAAAPQKQVTTAAEQAPTPPTLPAESAAPTPPASASLPPVPSLVTPSPALPTATTSPSTVPPGFVVVAPEESKQLLTSMLQQATSAFKVSEIKGKIEAFPKPATGDRKAARKLNDQGLAALKSDDFALALSSLKSAVATDPADIEVLNNYVYALIKAKRIQDAELEAGRLLTISPGRSSAWANLAEVYALKDKKDEAAAALILAFQFSSNKDRTVTFLNERAADGNSPMQAAAKKAIEIIQKM